jgi:hypothetical protein
VQKSLLQINLTAGFSAPTFGMRYKLSQIANGRRGPEVIRGRRNSGLSISPFGLLSLLTVPALKFLWQTPGT